MVISIIQSHAQTARTAVLRIGHNRTDPWPCAINQSHPGAVIGEGCKIGRECIVHPNAVLYQDVILGDRVEIHAGTVLGGDGFGYRQVDGRHVKVPHTGRLEIENDVEVGSNSTIDRATFETTRIGEGTKIDNLVQIGHNVVIGKHCLLCALVGVAGSVTLGDYVVVGGQSGLAGHLTVGSGAMIAAQSGVKDDIPAKTSVWGSPSMPLLLEQKLTILRSRLPELFKRVGALEERAGKA